MPQTGIERANTENATSILQNHWFHLIILC